MRLRYCFPIFLCVFLPHAGAVDPSQEFSFKAEPGRAVVITFKSAEQDRFEAVEIATVEQLSHGLKTDEFEFCQSQGWITAGAVVPADAFRKFSGPLVYVFLKDGLPLYVGRSSNGVSRPLAVGHGAADVRASCDDVRLYFCKERRHAYALESYLISKFQSPYNTQGVSE